jgi:hypothetical protein
MQTLNVDWSGASTLVGTGVHHGYRTAPADLQDLSVMDAIPPKYSEGIYSGFGPSKVRKLWWGMLEPGGFILPHIDKGPYHVRWHYPVEPAGFVWQNDLVTEPTEPFPITHWEPHAVWNPTNKRRIHLLVELDELVPDVDHNSPLTLEPRIEVTPELWEQRPDIFAPFPEMFSIAKFLS